MKTDALHSGLRAREQYRTELNSAQYDSLAQWSTSGPGRRPARLPVTPSTAKHLCCTYSCYEQLPARRDDFLIHRLLTIGG